MKRVIIILLVFAYASCTRPIPENTQSNVKFYRIVQVDKDGKQTISTVIKVVKVK